MERVPRRSPLAARPAPARETGAAILEAARRRFARFGPRKTSMEEVAREARCSRATVYAHFKSKEDLYARLLAQDAEEFIREAELALGELRGARQKIRRLVEITRATYSRNHVLRHALARDREMSLEPVAYAFTRDQERRIIELLRRALAQGVDEGSLRAIDPDRVAYLMFHLGSFLVGREVAGAGDHPFEEILGVMDDVFSRGISARPPSSGRRRSAGRRRAR